MKPHGTSHHSARLDPDRVRAIRAADLSTERFVDIGRRHGVSGVAAWKVYHRKTWAHVE